MRILLIANYPPDVQVSMQRFATMLHASLTQRGHSVALLAPAARLHPAARRTGAIWKWVAYVDKFVLFPLALRRAARNADVVHVCDHSNAMYTDWLRDTPDKTGNEVRRNDR